MKAKATPNGPKGSGSFDARRHLRILKAILIITNMMVLFMYASLFFIFADSPFVLADELKVMGNALAWATGFGLGFSFLIFAGDGISYLIRNRKRVKYPAATEPPAGHNYPVATPLMIKGPSAAMVNPEFSNN